jgi:hypothetical protein
MFQRSWQKEQNAALPGEALFQNYGINSPRERTHHFSLRLYKGTREHSIMLWFVVNCDLHGEIIVFLPCTYSSQNGISNLNQTGIHDLVLGPRNLAECRKVSLGSVLCLFSLYVFGWLKMLFSEFWNWCHVTLNRFSSQYQRKFPIKNFDLRMSSGMCRRVGLVGTDVSEKHIASVCRVKTPN